MKVIKMPCFKQLLIVPLTVRKIYFYNFKASELLSEKSKLENQKC